MLLFLSGQKQTDTAPYQKQRSRMDEQPFEAMERRPGNGGLGVMIIPVQIGTVRGVQPRQPCQNDQAQCRQRPAQKLSSGDFSPGKLQIDRFQLFGQNLDFVWLFLNYRFAQQSADGNFQRF